MNRVKYLVASVVLVGVGYYLRKVSTDKFLNKYVFAACVIVFGCMLIRVLIPEGFVLLPVLICGMAITIEVLKFFKLFYKAKLHKIPHLKAIIGDRFDIKLVFAYIIGAGIAMVLSRKDEY